jgi:two-component system, OmpR family, sensor kinase
MRQPVAGVFALAEAALADPDLPQGARIRLEQIVKLTEWLSDMIQQGLHADEPPQTAVRPLDLVDLAAEAADSERATYPGRLDVAQPEAPVLTCGNRVEIRRIIANLLSNATRAAGPAGTVRIGFGHGDDRATVIVEDSGPGFGRIQEGPGLGLRAVVRGVGISAGTIEYGRSPLGGVRVCVSFPMPSRWMPMSHSHAPSPV